MTTRDDQQRLLRAARERLDRVRDNPSTWPTMLGFVPAHEHQHAYDVNRTARFEVLWALQYDRRPQDLALLRFLLQQEITRYRDTVALGLAPDLELAGFLVAEHRQVQDVWLHWQAKNISFDTALGYRTHHLLTAGVEVTVASVRANSHPDRDRILREITQARNPDGTPRYTDTAVEDWLNDRRTRFPSDPAAENFKTWANYAAMLGDKDASRRFLLAWAGKQPRTEQTLNTLQFHLAQLGFLTEAIEFQMQAVEISEPDWTKASKLLTLAELHRRVDEFANAWATLRACADAMPNDPYWKDAGLWRHFIRAHFLLVPMAPDPTTARTLFNDGDRYRHDVSRLWMDDVLRRRRRRYRAPRRSPPTRSLPPDPRRRTQRTRPGNQQRMRPPVVVTDVTNSATAA